jgi:hypothetical protein
MPAVLQNLLSPENKQIDRTDISPTPAMLHDLLYLSFTPAVLHGIYGISVNQQCCTTDIFFTPRVLYDFISCTPAAEQDLYLLYSSSDA